MHQKPFAPPDPPESSQIPWSIAGSWRDVQDKEKYKKEGCEGKKEKRRKERGRRERGQDSIAELLFPTYSRDIDNPLLL